MLKLSKEILPLKSNKSKLKGALCTFYYLIFTLKSVLHRKDRNHDDTFACPEALQRMLHYLLFS